MSFIRIAYRSVGEELTTGAGIPYDGYTTEGIVSPPPSNHYLLIDPQEGLEPHRVQILKTSHGVALWPESDWTVSRLPWRNGACWRMTVPAGLCPDVPLSNFLVEYGRSLEEDICSDTSFMFQRVLVSLTAVRGFFGPSF